MLNRNILILFLIFTSLSFAQPTLIPKQGGICFRVDDNGDIPRFVDYINLFSSYNQKSSFALNLGEIQFDEAEYRDYIKSVQDLGHEIMDHTPQHRTNFFTTKFDTALYSNLAGVDHKIDNKICLEFIKPDITDASINGLLDIQGNTLNIPGSEFNNFDENNLNIRYLYIPDLDTLLFLPLNSGSPTGVVFKDFWEEDIILSDTLQVEYYGFIRDNIRMTSDALTVLSGETLKLASLINLDSTKIKVWIQPGGDHPLLWREDIKSAMETNYGYVGGAVATNSSYKVFNEYDANNDKKFGMQWEDFSEDEAPNALRSIRKIADGIAKNRLLIGHSHFYAVEGTKWAPYIARVDSILAWSTANNIPIRTYSEWSDIVYNQTPDPYENIIPPLSVNLDNNARPDGYYDVDPIPTSYFQSTWEVDSTAPEGYALSKTNEGIWDGITFIHSLGGLEKGENEFEIWTKGAVGNEVQVTFRFGEWGNPDPYPEIVCKFPADTEEWTKYNISQSLTSDKALIVPSDVSLLNIFIERNDPIVNSSLVKISGMKLYKKVQVASLDLTLLDAIPAFEGDTIRVEITAKDAAGIPVNSVESYTMEAIGSSTAQFLPSNIYSFNGSTKDTILVTDLTAETFNIKAVLDSDISVTAQKEVQFVYSPKLLSLKTFLEGPYVQLADSMTTDINSNIPNLQPYTSYGGSESVNPIPADIVDWVLVSLRKDINPLTPDPSTSVHVSTRAALLNKDGLVVDLDGVSPISFSVMQGNYYIVLQHRNHISIMSSTTISLN